MLIIDNRKSLELALDLFSKGKIDDNELDFTNDGMVAVLEKTYDGFKDIKAIKEQGYIYPLTNEAMVKGFDINYILESLNNKGIETTIHQKFLCEGEEYKGCYYYTLKMKVA